MDSQWDKFDSRYNRKRIVLAVGQLPFDAGGRTFCTLAPVMEMDGQSIERQLDFPSRGEVWWMLTFQTQAYAEPGRLVTATLEEAPEKGNDRAYYQAIPDSLDSIREDQFVEIVSIAPGQVHDARDVIHPSFVHQMEHPPCAIVYVRIGDALHGPLYASSTQVAPAHHEVRFKAARENRCVFEVPYADIQDHIAEARVTVSVDSIPTWQGGDPLECRYTLLVNRALDRALPRARTQTWKTPGDIVREVTKRLFDRRLVYKKDRQAFLNAFQEIESVLLQTADVALEEDEKEVFALIRQNLDHIQKEAQDLADDLVNSGLIEDKISVALDKKMDEYIQTNSAQLRARIEQQVADVQQNLTQLETTQTTLEDEIASQRQQKLEEVEKEVSARRSQLDHRAREIQELQEALERDRHLVTETLNEVAQQLLSSKEGIIKQFMTLAPLVQGFLLPLGSSTSVKDATAAAAPKTSGAPAEVRLSPFVRKTVSTERQTMGETAFFERFCTYVENCGFWHRRIDLVSMHLSCKTNDITILGGQPGTGKSTLPKLYADALQGDEKEEGDRYLHVGVNPSWVDARDLLGYVNAFEQKFQPSESGLYMHLVNASEEERIRGAQSGMWLVCLDEMNLAQVEHYFGCFLQALDRPIGSRTISCFAPEIVSQDNSLHKWATIHLPPSVRFVGTVNFDETTRQLSQRLLDRACMIRLRPPRTAPESTSGVLRAVPSGTPVNVACISEWLRAGETVPPEIGGILDELEKPLARLGCALNPRRSRAIARFIANAPASLCSPRKALDLQVAQRLLPRVRGLFRAGAHEHFEQLKRIIEKQTEFEESLWVLHEMSDDGLMSTADSEQ